VAQIAYWDQALLRSLLKSLAFVWPNELQQLKVEPQVQRAVTVRGDGGLDC
jgi:hypothetical protein